MYRSSQIFSGENLNCFSYLSLVVLSNKESYGGKSVFGPDVGYVGTVQYHERSDPNKQEEPLGSVCQTKTS